MNREMRPNKIQHTSSITSVLRSSYHKSILIIIIIIRFTQVAKIGLHKQQLKEHARNGFTREHYLIKDTFLKIHTATVLLYSYYCYLLYYI